MLSLRQALAWIPGGELHGDGALRCARVHSDTRTLAPGDLFVAIRATRSSAFGRCNIGFGPLASATLDPQMLPAVRDWLVRDLREGAS